MVKNKWSKNWFNLLFACWNCFSLSNKRLQFCKTLDYDVLALTELYNVSKTKFKNHHFGLRPRTPHLMKKKIVWTQRQA